ncbi:putative short-chain dehydrogenase [Aspergillus stella-maris]|uniref:putative short-chain dehydrogenase n=1 Tax=Aspergillus stella-maris TaxID=1810926 RepID=UPI003CCD16D4
MSPRYNERTTATELTETFSSQIRGKVVLTTGPSPKSIGAVFVQTIAAAKPALLILAGRNTSKLQQTADAVKAVNPVVAVRLLSLDLGSLAAVQKAAEEVNGWNDVPHIDVLVNNAGIMGTKFALSPDGFESQFATNHLGHFLFTNLVIGKILKASEPRVVNVSSDGHRLGPIRWGDYNFKEGKTYNKWSAYGQSKTANILMAVSLAEKLGSKGLLAYSLHPGVIFGTSLSLGVDNAQAAFGELDALDKALGNVEGWEDFKKKTDQEGAATTVYAAFEPELRDSNGAYLQDCHVADPWTETVKPWATDKTEAERLWKLSEKLVGQDATKMPKQDTDDTPHFASIPWVSTLLSDPTFKTIPISYRTPSRKIPREDRLFSTTLNSPGTIAHHLAQYRPPQPNANSASQTQAQAEAEKQIHVLDERHIRIPTSEVRIFVTLGSEMDGYADVLHGGMVSTLLDEVMGLILVLSLAGTGQEDGKSQTGEMKAPVTAYLNTRFRAPVGTPGTYVVCGRVERVVGGRKWVIKGDIRDGEGRALADAECLYVSPRGRGGKI